MNKEEILEAGTYSIKKTYSKLRGEYRKVPWRRVVCNKLGKPKWIFILNLAIHGKLYTTDRLERWALLTDTACPLCNNAPESHQHLFFECTESSKLWQKLLKWMNVTRGVRGWLAEVEWATKHASGRTTTAELYRMVLAACVYFVWQEINSIISKKQGII